LSPDRLKRSRERLGRQIQRHLGVAAVTQERAVDSARMPAIEGGERVCVHTRTPQQFAVVEAWGVHLPTSMHNGRYV
jgi:hypothetical protein